LTSDEIKIYFNNAITLDPEELKRIGFFEDVTLNELYPIDGIILGYHAPWEKTNNKILFRPSELSVWSGIMVMAKVSS